MIIQGIMGNDGRVIDMRTPVDRMSDRAMDSLRQSYVPPVCHDFAPPIEPRTAVRDLYPHDIRADCGPNMGLIGKPVESTWGVPSRTPDPVQDYSSQRLRELPVFKPLEPIFKPLVDPVLKIKGPR